MPQYDMGLYRQRTLNFIIQSAMQLPAISYSKILGPTAYA